MGWLEIFGAIASAMAIFEVGYLIGKFRGSRHARRTEDALVAERIRQAFGSVEITALNCEPNSTRPGGTLSVAMTILSRATFPHEVWLGASVVDGSEREMWDVTQDKAVVLEPGTHRYSRYLTLPSGASPGTCELIAAVYVGQRGNPGQSIRLADVRRRDALAIS